MAVVMSEGAEAAKWMDVGKKDALFRDATGQVPGDVRTNGEGFGQFRCARRSLSVWQSV